MKRCPRCHHTYADDELNFCLEDGELLVHFAAGAPPPLMENQTPTRYADDPPPTLLLNQPRITNQTTYEPPVPWQAQQLGQFPQYASPNQNLAIISLALGAGSLTIGWCCSLGLALGPAAMITGFIALSQIKKDPQKYGGRGLAIGGIITGALFLLLYILFIIIYGAFAIIGSGFN